MLETDDEMAARFPVVQSVPLQPVRQRRFRRPNRTPDEIPAPRPGTVMVGQYNDVYELVPPGSRLNEPAYTTATMILLVSTRHQLVPTVVMLPSADPRTAVRINARFQCRVTDPVMLLQAGGWAVEPLLVEQLLGSAKLRMACLSQFEVATWYRFQQRIMALLLAHVELNTALPGLSARLADVLITPAPVQGDSGGWGGDMPPPANPFDAVPQQPGPSWPTWPTQPARAAEPGTGGLVDGDPSIARRYSWDGTP